MQLEPGLWLTKRFYIDHNDSDELRVVGPRNHLYFGAVGTNSTQLQLASIDDHDELTLTLTLDPDTNFWPDPAMGHIRRVRQYIQVLNQAEYSFAQATRQFPTELAPARITTEYDNDVTTVTYTRTYAEHFYGVKLTWGTGVTLLRDEEARGYRLERAKPGPITIKLETISDELPPLYDAPIFAPRAKIKLPNQLAEQLYERTTAEIEHLIRNSKTSGFDYGTVFPRDWMETADLIAGELTPQTYAYMYQAALRHVNQLGAGWHEDIVGEYAHERQDEIDHLGSGFDTFVAPAHPLNQQFRQLLGQLDELFVTRLMVDIEPHYLLSLRRIPFAKFSATEQAHLRRVAEFVVRRAADNSLVTFNRVAAPFKRQRADEYYEAGNWRDSNYAYKRISPVIAPYDVNVVLYPQALRVILEHANDLQVNIRHIEQLVGKWSRVADWYRFTNPDGKTASALALYNISDTTASLPTFDQFAINHTDEAYNLRYGEPFEDEILSFCQRLLSPDYFYTPSGPLLVGHGQGYTQAEYHGEVIWTKQTAYIITGLERQLAAKAKTWHPATTELVRTTIGKTAEASLHAFRTLGSVPELHIDKAGQPALYTDQPAPEAQMNKVQLWSAAGARPIIRAAFGNYRQ